MVQSPGSTGQTCGRTDQIGKKLYAQHYIQGQKDQHTRTKGPTYNDKRTNFWARERTKVIYVISISRKRSCAGHGASTASKTTDGPRLSPLGDHSTKKTRETSQAVERRPGNKLEGHDLAEDSSTQANLYRRVLRYSPSWWWWTNYYKHQIIGERIILAKSWERLQRNIIMIDKLQMHLSQTLRMYGMLSYQMPKWLRPYSSVVITMIRNRWMSCYFFEMYFMCAFYTRV